MACGGVFDFPHAFDFRLTLGAAIGILDALLTVLQWQAMARFFIGDTEIRAGLTPFRAMGGDALAPRAMMSDQMRELVTQNAIHDCGIEALELGIHLDLPMGPPCPTCRGAHSRIPHDIYFFRQRG